MIEDTERQDRPGRTSLSARSRRDVVNELREGMADRVPVALRALPPGTSWAVPWRAAIVALVLAVVVGTAFLARAQGTTQEVSPAVPRRSASAQAAPPEASPARSGAAGMVVAHVIGKVRRPGLVRLAAGCRVSDAVTAAGGPAPQARLDRLNLARVLGDGEQIMVPGPNDPMPSVGALAADTGSTNGSAGGANGLVDLNTATIPTLDALPGVGPVLAGRILAWRTQHGRFSRVAELGEVPGIGDKLLARLTPLARV